MFLNEVNQFSVDGLSSCSVNIDCSFPLGISSRLSPANCLKRNVENILQ